MGEHRPSSWSAAGSRARQRIKRARKGKTLPKPSRAGKAPKKGYAKAGMKARSGKMAPKPSPAGQAATKETPHRFCCRCHRRLDKCLADGCKPYAFPLNSNNFRVFRNARQRPSFPRFHADCIDVRCVAHWGRKALKDRHAIPPMLVRGVPDVTTNSKFSGRGSWMGGGGSGGDPC